MGEAVSIFTERIGWKGRGGSWLRRFLTAAVIGAALLVIGSFGYHALRVLSFPYELTSGEGFLLRDPVYLRTAQALYTDPNQSPYIISVYPPIYPAVVAFASLVGGNNLSTSRFVAMLSVFLTCLVIMVLVYTLTRQRLPAFLSGAAYAGSLFVYQWGVFGRVDTLAVLFSTFALLIAVRHPDRVGAGLSALVCLLALYTKQIAIAAPLTILIFLWINDRQSKQRALGTVGTFLITLGGVGGSLFAWATWQTHGQFYEQLVRDNVQTYSWRALGGYWRALLLTHPLPLIVAAGYLIIRLRERFLRNNTPRLILPVILPIAYVLINGAMTWTIGRNGASISYFLEFIAALLILFGVAWAEWAKAAPRVAPMVLSLALIGQWVWPFLFVLSPLKGFYQPDPVFGWNPSSADVQNCQQLDTLVTQVQGAVLAEDVGILVAHNRDPIGSAWLFNALRGQGIIDAGLCASQTGRGYPSLRAGAAALAVLSARFFEYGSGQLSQSNHDLVRISVASVHPRILIRMTPWKDEGESRRLSNDFNHSHFMLRKPTMFDFTPFTSKEKTASELGIGLTQDDLRRFTNTMLDTVTEILAGVTDADIVYVPTDPGAKDIVTHETDAWTIGHQIVHATASSEEGAALALVLSRGVKVEGRSRYETAWETVQTAAQVMQRLAESRRMRLAMLDAWPDKPDLDNVEVHPYFGSINALSRFMLGLSHENDHLEQLRDTVRQAKTARGA